jgi:hypothetical protein
MRPLQATFAQVSVAVVIALAVAVNPVLAITLPCCCTKVESQAGPLPCCQAKAVKKVEHHACCAKRALETSSTTSNHAACSTAANAGFRAGCCCVQTPPAGTAERTVKVAARIASLDALPAFAAVLPAPSLLAADRQPPGLLTPARPPLQELYCIWLN